MFFFTLALSSCKKDKISSNNSNEEYIDLGLPSGTKWKSTNENGNGIGFYFFEEAVRIFGNQLPTKVQFEELKYYCTWTWQNNESCKVTGTNGNFIILPAAGFVDPYEGTTDGDGGGYYWSSTPCVGEEACSYSLLFGEDEGEIWEGVGYFPRNYGLSVRLVQQ